MLSGICILHLSQRGLELHCLALGVLNITTTNVPVGQPMIYEVGHFARQIPRASALQFAKLTIRRLPSTGSQCADLPCKFLLRDDDAFPLYRSLRQRRIPRYVTWCATKELP